MFHSHLTPGQALVVCLFSLVVVFLVLLATSWLIDLTAWLLQKLRRPSCPPAAPSPAPQAPASGEDHARAVLITAAVAACLGSDRFVVRSIRPLPETDTPWGQAGRVERTQ